jgi:amino acid transporter
MAYVGAEVRNPEKNIVRALVLGTVAVTLIYVLINLAMVQSLGFQGLSDAKTAAAEEVVRRSPAGAVGGRLVSLLICITALGAINGMIFTGSRIYYALGTEHRLYAWLGQWSARHDAPVRSLLIQAVATIALAIGFGLTPDGFESSVKFTSPVFWAFFFLVGVGLFVLRYREPGQSRPFRVPLYPLTPIVFCLSSLFMVYRSFTYALENKSNEAYWSIGILAIGLVLSFFDPRINTETRPSAKA